MRAAGAPRHSRLGARRAALAEGDAARLHLGALLDRDAKHAVLEVAARALGIGALGQRERPVELSERPLGGVVPLALLRLLGLTAAAHGERVLRDRDLDVLLLHAG